MRGADVGVLALGERRSGDDRRSQDTDDDPVHCVPFFERARNVQPAGFVVNVRAMIAVYLVRHGIAVDHQDRGLEELRPDVGPGKLLTETARQVKNEQSVVLVGHDPQMTELVVTLAGLSKEDAARVNFRKGAIVRIDVGELPSARPSQPRWWLNPKTRELSKGLPLRKKPVEAKARATRAP